MKKFLCLILCAVLLTLPLCACGGEEEGAGTGVTIETESENKWIEDRFDQAERLYAWHTGCARPSCNASDSVDTGEAVYVCVTEPGLDSYDALRERINSLFDPLVAQPLTETVVYSGAPVFKDINGALYCCRDASGQVPYDIGQRIGTVDSQTDTEIVYRVDITYDYYASSFAASYDYHLVKGEDGVWRFTNFQLPALLIAEQMFNEDSGQ